MTNRCFYVFAPSFGHFYHFTVPAALLDGGVMSYVADSESLDYSQLTPDNVVFLPNWNDNPDYHTAEFSRALQNHASVEITELWHLMDNSELEPGKAVFFGRKEEAA